MRSQSVSRPWEGAPADEPVRRLLQKGEVASCQLLPQGSNYTFLVAISNGQEEVPAIYKPKRGETSLWDFPSGSLYRREYAAYLVSQALGWDFVPATVIRDGPHGIGSVQLMVAAKPGTNYFTLRHARPGEFQRIAAFDFIANNADRKGGHCLEGRDGRIWGIDHGLTFHAVYKMRTVIWDFQGQPIPPELLTDMENLLEQLGKQGHLFARLTEMLAPAEVVALKARLEAMLEMGVFPGPGPHRSVPWPAI